MADLSKLNVDGVNYNLKDTTAREEIANIKQSGTNVVKSVNGQNPDTNGNVEIDLTDVVKSINGQNPDANGNVTIDIPGATSATLLVSILRNAIYSTDQSASITLLESTLLYGGNGGGGSSGGGGSESGTQYSVTNILTNVTNNNSNAKVTENGMYIATLTANAGYAIDSVTVTMGGVNVTASVYSGGAVTIPSVTGNIVITASAVKSATGAYVQSGLLHEFTDLTSKKTIIDGQSIFNSENDFTIFFSAKKQDTDANYHKTIVGHNGESNNNQFKFVITWNGIIHAQVWLTDSSKWPVIEYTPEDKDVMQHFAVVKSGNTYTLYEHDSSVGTMSSDGKQYILEDDLVINEYDSVINKILIYNRALTQAEITLNHQAIVGEVGE